MEGQIRPVAHIFTLALVTVALVAPPAVASPALAAEATPKTTTHKTVSHHRQAAQRIVTRGFKHKDWEGGHDFNKKKKRKVRAHRAAIAGAPAHQKKIDRFVIRKRASYQDWAAKQAAKADPWGAAYRSLSPGLRSSLAALSVCESGNRNLTHGYFGWTHWYAIPSLGIPGWMVSSMASSPPGASYEQQSVITAAVAARHGWGGWPACSARLGL